MFKFIDLIKNMKGSDKLSFEDIATKWLAQKKIIIKQSTYAKYLQTINKHLLPKLKEINELTEKIDTIKVQKNACNRIITRYEEIKEEYKKQIESKEKAQDLMIADKRKKQEIDIR